MTAQIFSIVKARVEDEAWTVAVLMYDQIVGPTSFRQTTEGRGFSLLWDAGFPIEKRAIADSLLAIRAEAEQVDGTAVRVSHSELALATLVLHDCANSFPFLTDSERAMVQRWMLFCKDALGKRTQESISGHAESGSSESST